MKLSTKGIAWLIFGVLVIISSFESYGWANKLSTMGIGVTFVLVYVMKQFFKPRLYGLFIAGGILLSFCIYNGINEDLVFPLFLAAVFMGAFYLKNKGSVDAMVEDIDSLGDDEIENFDYVAPESYEDTNADTDSSDVASASVEDGDAADKDGAIETETNIPAPVPKTVEFDFEPNGSKQK